MIQLAILLLLFRAALCDDFARQPVYKYRYETEDVMKTAATNIPVHGYHVIEGGYYPSEKLVAAGGLGGYGGVGQFGGGAGYIGGAGGYGGQSFGGKIGPIGGGVGPVGYGSNIGYGGAGIGYGSGLGAIGHGGLGYGGLGYGGAGYSGGLGYGGAGLGGAGYGGAGYGGAGYGGIGVAKYGGAGLIGGGVGGGIGGAGLGGAGIGIGGGGIGIGGGLHHGYGGEEIEKGEFSGAKKNLNDEHFEKSHGKKGEEINHGESGFQKGEVVAKDAKGDSGFYSNADGEKQVFEDGKEYHGGQHFNKEGKSGEEKTVKQGHKKGHKIKSFKTSHHKDESGKTEEFYDEAHDEGGNYAFNGEEGSFGENGAKSFKGGNQEGKYNTGESKKEGHFENKYLLDKANANEGKYGGNKYAGNGVVYGAKNGADEQSLLGHEESSKVYKHHPFVVPFHYK